MSDEKTGISGAMPALGLGMDIANTVGGWFGGNTRQQESYRNQRRLNEQMAQLQRENWDYTNAENQVKHYENAGLNVGLMYGGSGGGGATMGGGSGGSSPMPETPKIMGLGIQGAMAESQIEVNKASAEKMKAEATKIAGVDTTKTGVEIESLSQGIKNQQAQEKLTDMQTNLMGVEYDIKNATINDQIGIVRNEVQKGLKEIYILEKQGKITDEEAKVAREKWRLELAGMGLKNLLTKAQEDNTIQMTEESKQRILQGWKDKNIQQFSEEIKAEYPSLWNVIGKSINEIYDLAGEIDNRNPNEKTRKVK